MSHSESILNVDALVVLQSRPVFRLRRPTSFRSDLALTYYEFCLEVLHRSVVVSIVVLLAFPMTPTPDLDPPYNKEYCSEYLDKLQNSEIHYT